VVERLRSDHIRELMENRQEDLIAALARVRGLLADALDLALRALEEAQREH